jgi:repressor LexA
MHDVQIKLLELSKNKRFKGLTLREIGRLVEIDHPQLIKHHLQQLINRGLLNSEYEPVSINSNSSSRSSLPLILLPILGSANCGEPTLLANEDLQGYLKISPSLLKTSQYDDLFVLKAAGNSMNRAKVNKIDPIEDGDYVVVKKSTDIHDKAYVVSVIDGAANIKKIHIDKINNLIYLLSESTVNYPPIVIDQSTDFSVNGNVIQVVKKPKPSLN